MPIAATQAREKSTKPRMMGGLHQSAPWVTGYLRPQVNSAEERYAGGRKRLMREVERATKPMAY